MDTHTKPLLHIGDQQEFLEEAVTAGDLEVAVQSVDSVSAAATVLEDEPVSGIVVEAECADGPAFELLDSAANEGPQIPVLVLTTESSLAADAIRAGASEAFVRDGSQAETTLLGQRLKNLFARRGALTEHAATLSDAALLLDGEGRIVTATLGSQPALDETAEQLVGEWLPALVRDADVEWTKKRIEEFAAADRERERMRVSFDREDGASVPGEIQLSRLSTGGTGQFVVASIQDVLRHSERSRETTPLIDLLLDTIDDVFYLLDADGNLVRWNESLGAVTGYDDDELAEIGPLGLFTTEDRDRVAETITEVVETGSGTVEATMLTKDGEEVPFEYTGVALGDPEETTRGIVGIGRNVAEQRARERELQEYETIIEVLADPVYTVDSDGRYAYVNDAFVEHTGYSRKEVLGSHVSKVLPEKEIERGREVIRDLLTADDRQSRTWEMTRVTADGEEISTENHTALLPPDEDGQYRGSVGVIRDISGRKEREKNLRRERNRLRSVFDAAPYPFVHVSYENDEPVVLNVNNNFEEMFGYGEQQLLGETLDSYIVPASERSEAEEFNARMRAGEQISAEVTRTTEGGSEREFLFKSATLTREDGTVEALWAYVDITERKRRIDLLEQLRRNITDVVWMTDAEKGSMDFISDAYEDVWGRSTESLREQPVSFVDAIHPEDRDRVQSAVEAQQNNPDEYEETYRVQQPDGEIRWVHDRSSGVYEDGELKRIIGIATDITERREREEELRLKNQAMDEAPIGITIHDANTAGAPITYANEGFETVTGYGPDAVEGQRLSMLAGAETDDAKIEELSTAFEERRPASLAMLLYSDDGHPFWGRISVAPVDDDGTTTHFVGFLQDVTTIKEHEQEVARRLEEFGELLAEDLRVPVQQAQSEIESASGSGATAELDAASRSLERVDDLIDDLITVHTRSVTSREVGDVLTAQSGRPETGEDR